MPSSYPNTNHVMTTTSNDHVILQQSLGDDDNDSDNGEDEYDGDDKVGLLLSHRREEEEEDGDATPLPGTSPQQITIIDDHHVVDGDRGTSSSPKTGINTATPPTDVPFPLVEPPLSTTTTTTNPLPGEGGVVTPKQDISTYEIFRKYRSAIHFPNWTFENVRSITITIMPLVAHALAAGYYNSDGTTYGGGGYGGSSSSPDSNLSLPPSSSSTYHPAASSVVIISNINTNNNGTTTSLTPLSTTMACINGCADQLIGILYSMMSLGTVVGNIPTGMLARHLPLQLVPTITGFIYIVTNSALILALYFGSYDTVYAALIMASFFWGMAFSPFSVGRLLYVQHSVPKEWHSRLMSTVGGLQRWSMVSGPFIAGLAVEYLPGGVMAALGINIPMLMIFIALVLLSTSLRSASDELEVERDNLEWGRSRGWRHRQHQCSGRGAIQSHITTVQEQHHCSSQFARETRGTDEIEMKPLVSADEGECSSDEISLTVSPSCGVKHFKGIATSTVNVYSQFDDETTSTPAKPHSLLTEVRRNMYVVLVVGTFSFIMQMMRVNRTMLISVQALRLGLAPSVIGTVLSASFFVDATLFLLGGYVGDKFGMRFQTAVASACLGLSFIALSIPGATTDSVAFAQLILVGVLFGLANSLGSGLLLALVATHAPKSKGNGVLTVMRSMQDAGPLVGSLGAGFLLRYVSFEYTCLLFGIVGLANAIFGAVMIPQTRRGG